MLTVLGISLVWALLELREPKRLRRRTQAAIYAALLVMIVWLLIGARSATAIGCTTVGVGLLIAMRMRTVRINIRGWVTATVVLGTLIAMTGAWTLVQDALVERLGRDPTLHGRKEIWAAVLNEGTNLFFGTGFYSFWTAERVQRLSAEYFYDLTEAHNGYLEVYLNGGLIGLGLLLGLLCATAMIAIRGLEKGASPLAALGLVLLIVSILYGVTEAVFSRLSLVWFGLLLAALSDVPSKAASLSRRVLSPRRKTEEFAHRSHALKDSRGDLTPEKRSSTSQRQTFR